MKEPVAPMPGNTLLQSLPGTVVAQLVQLVNKELLDLQVFLVHGNYWSYLVEVSLQNMARMADLHVKYVRHMEHV